jgi:hypothetical protein
MSSIVLLDTSIYLNVLNVPGWNQDRIQVFADFRTKIAQNDYFLLPMATIWETGNHIADLENGGLRRTYAQKFADDVSNALTGVTPYKATHFPNRDQFVLWLAQFPEYASRNKSLRKLREGISLADLSMIKEWEQNCELHNMSRVLIWSLDSDLQGYDRQP